VQDDLARQLADRLLANPEFKNQINAEPLPQSRVAQGTAAAMIGALGIVLQQLSGNDFLQYDWAILGPALLALWGGSWGLYGRVATGLKPVFSAWSWFRS
jgi:hypothetical protein